MSHLVKALWDELWFVNMGYTNKIWLIDWLIYPEGERERERERERGMGNLLRERGIEGEGWRWGVQEEDVVKDQEKRMCSLYRMWTAEITVQASDRVSFFCSWQMHLWPHCTDLSALMKTCKDSSSDICRIIIRQEHMLVLAAVN